MKLVLTLQKIVRIWCRTASFLLQIYSFRNKTGLISVWLSQSAQTYQTICATELQTSFCYVYRLQQTPTSSDETVPFCVSCCGMCLAPLCSFITSQALKHNISHPCVPCSSARGHCSRHLYALMFSFFRPWVENKHRIDVLDEKLLTHFYVSHSGICERQHNK